MSLFRLVRSNIRGNAFRSLAVFICASLVAGVALVSTFVVRGAEASLRTNLDRLGADLLVLPWGTMTEKIGGVRLMSAAVKGWIPRPYMARVEALEGVAEVSPQLHLGTVKGSPYSRQPELFLVAYEPDTDFVLRPWLEKGTGQMLAEGEAVVGALVSIPEADELPLYGFRLRVVARLEPTATSIDSTVFVGFDTAAKMVASSSAQGQGALKSNPGDSVSAVMVKVDLGSDPHQVAVRILERVPGVVPLETPDLFQSERRQMIGVLQTMLTLLAAIWVLAVVFMGLVFSIAAHERRVEIGVLRALGFPQRFIIETLLMEGAVLALAGGLLGVVTTAIGLVALGHHAVQAFGLPIQFPSPLGMASLSLGSQMAALASVTLAALIPAWRISRQEVAATMRE